jgi:hypothetical protein
MPYQPSTFQLPSGARCARFMVTGIVTGKEAAEMIARLDPGGRGWGCPCWYRGNGWSG